MPSTGPAITLGLKLDASGTPTQGVPKLRACVEPQTIDLKRHQLLAFVHYPGVTLSYPDAVTHCITEGGSMAMVNHPDIYNKLKHPITGGLCELIQIIVSTKTRSDQQIIGWNIRGYYPATTGLDTSSKRHNLVKVIYVH